jgi:hypothetical protein
VNLVDSARALYPKILTCVHCGVVIDQQQADHWRDRAGNGWCPPDRMLQHVPAPYVARSPTLGGLL